MDKLAPGSHANPAVPVWHNPIRFPLRDQMDIIHGRGTIALELERDLAMLAQNSSTRPHGFKSSLDFVIADMDNGITLSGICMAFAGTRTQVFGAAPMSGFWEYAAKPHLPPGETYGHEYWEGVDVPMAAIPWATFREPGNLAGVLEVDNEQIYAAMLAAREAYGLQLDPDEVVPLAVALCHEEFGRLVARTWNGEDEGPTVGIILRSRKGRRVVSVAMEGC
jgi:threonine dehydratase